MQKKRTLVCFFTALVLPFLMTGPRNADAKVVSLGSEDAAWIANMIFKNECRWRTECLTTWNEGEDFPSLGIGHFIWYPADRRGPFRESFPDLVSYLKSIGRPVPDWLEEMMRSGMPWKDRESFLNDLDGEAMVGMRQYLLATMDAQAFFMIRRFQNSLAGMVQILPIEERALFLEKVFALTKTRNGLYAMIDYANFKGDGLSENERYHTHGWGLFQVMRQMPWPAESGEVEKAFVESARKILRRRVDNAPTERREDRWIEGWVSRVQTYSDNSELVLADPQTESLVTFPQEARSIEVVNFADLATV